MRLLSRLTSFSLGAVTAATSYYLYFIYDNGYYYNHSVFKQIDDTVRDSIENSTPLDSIFKRDINILNNKNPQNIEVRYMKETFKDMWNAQIRNTVEWIYSFGK